ncbi:MAG: aspartate aminotransferase [Candidatus Wallbacteria bacterium HGW-Wallbacteria-1]|jgi:aspartate aminotransferase|uniref:Aspartate aminotransferase n=1 Tax=Candidatus Wallbacteria bacterium HGW-Wallbacteria-1 TaxID=2013854 RepID=A0A2N1PPZ0_9BACT|nr:MAG: aspartate aminotransferase [Candidatus Wallbacteria bacterium HGW-Wallbacteria-1]
MTSLNKCAAKVSHSLSGLSQSSTLAMNEKARQMVRDGVQNMLFFTVGEPDLPVPQHIADAMSLAISQGKTRYTEATGLPELKSAIARKLMTENNIPARADEILISCGAKHSIFNVLASIINPGDEVVVPVPYWVSYPPQIKLLGGVPIYVRGEDGVRFTAEDVTAAFNERTRAVILNSPSNPSGFVLPSDQIIQIAEKAASMGIFIISDEIYEKIVFDADHFSPASISREVRDFTFTVNGFSKAYCMTGLRVGYVHGPIEHIKAAGRYQGHVTSNPCSVSQYGAIAALSGPQNCVDTLREDLRRRREIMVSGLARIKGFDCPGTQGTFYVFPDVTATGMTGDELVLTLLEENHVAVVAGSGFGCPERIRFSCAVPLSDIQQMLQRLEARFGLSDGN